jgi:hypothetical protein
MADGEERVYREALYKPSRNSQHPTRVQPKGSMETDFNWVSKMHHLKVLPCSSPAVGGQMEWADDDCSALRKTLHETATRLPHTEPNLDLVLFSLLETVLEAS